MINKTRNLEKGQSLVVVTILLFVFIAMLALVLDGGYAYFMRRNAQNAADAGALAAADTWCETQNWAWAEENGLQFAMDENGAHTANVFLVDQDGNGDLDEEDRIVHVDTSITFNTFFGTVLGRDQITAVADASAGCYPPASVHGVLPVAWACSPPNIDEEDEFDSEDCKFFYGDEDFPYDGQIYVIMDIDKVEDDLWCQDPVTKLPPEYLDCDIDDDGIDDILRGGQRSWLDLDTDSSNAAEIADWISGDEEVFLRTHVWLRATDGGVASAFHAANEKVGERVVLPVFNAYCDLKSEGLPASTNLKDTTCYQDYIAYDESNGGDTGGDPVWGDNGSLLYDHVISFMIFEITCVSAPPAKYGDCDGKDAAVDEGLAGEHEPSIEGFFVKGFVPDSSGGPNNNPWTGAYTVYLID